MFLTRLILEADDQPGVWIVSAALDWRPLNGRLRGCDDVVVPPGTLTDLASVPRVLRNVPFLDTTGRSRRGAVLHDFLYRGGVFRCGRRPTRGEADRILFRALRADGCSRWVAGVFYAGVRVGGWAAWVTIRSS